MTQTRRFLLIGAAVAAIAILPTHAAFSWTPSSPQVTVSVFEGNDFSNGTAVAPSASGGVIVGGTFRGTVDFDPGPGTTNLTATSSNDGFVAKLDSSGNLVWVRRISARTAGALLNIGVTSLVEGASGNIFVTGSFRGEIDLHPGLSSPPFNSSPDNDDVPSNDGFLLRMSSTGTFEWGGAFGAGNDDSGISLAIDSSGDVIVSGRFYDTVDFDFGSGVEARTASGNADVFIARYTTSGALVWVKVIAGTLGELLDAMANDSSGGLYLTGQYVGSSNTDFDPGLAVETMPTSGNAVFVVKLNASGVFQWSRSFSVPVTPNTRIAVSNGGAVTVSGNFEGTVDFDPGSGVSNKTAPVGVSNSFIVRLNSSGNFEWVKTFGAGVSVNSALLDSTSNAYLVGAFSDTVDFDPGSSTRNLAAAGLTDIFMLKLDPVGNLVWANRFGANFDDSASAAFVDGSANLHVTGSFTETVDFDPGDGTANFFSGRDGLDNAVPTAFMARTDSLGSTATTTTTTSTTTTSTTSTTVASATTLAPATTTATTSSTSAVATTTMEIAPSKMQWRSPSESVIKKLPEADPALIADATFESGQPFVVTRGGFKPMEPVQMVVASKPQVISIATADATGTVSLRGRIPFNLAPGRHTLAIFAPETRRGFKQPIVVSPRLLPNTGSGDFGAFFSISVIVICAGVGVVLLQRARRCR